MAAPVLRFCCLVSMRPSHSHDPARQEQGIYQRVLSQSFPVFCNIGITAALQTTKPLFIEIRNFARIR